MPIYDQHYRLWQGRPQPRWLRWSVITRYHLRLLFTGKGRNALLILLFVMGMIHFVFLMIIYLYSNPDLMSLLRVPVNELMRIDAHFFLRPLLEVVFPLAFLILIVGSGLIADDRRDNAIPFYLSKPLTPAEYLLGKAGVIAFFVLAVTLVPVNLLFVFEVLMHGGRAFLVQYWWLPLAISALSVLIAALAVAIMLLASSLVKKAALAGVIVVGFLIGHNVIVKVLGENFRSERFELFSLPFDVQRVAFWLFGLEDIAQQRGYVMTGPQALQVLLVVTGVCLLLVWWRIRPVEVVK